MSIIVLSASLLGQNASAIGDKKLVTIGTGGVTGVYYPAGGAICRLVNRTRQTTGIRCSVESTDGSIANIEMLRKGEIDIAVVQSDWQFHAYNGSDYFAKEKPFKNMRALFSLHSEPFTVIVRKDSGITKFDDIKGKRVNFGSVGSGIRATMDVIVKQKGWKNTDFAKVTELKPSEQTDALCNKDSKTPIDVMIYTAGHPNGAVQEVTTTCETKIIPVDGPDIDKMIQANPYYAYTIIPGGMYNGTPNDVKTIGVKATFLTTAEQDDETIYQVVKAVFDNFDNFKTLHPVFGLLDASKLVHEGNTAPLHPGAIRYFKEKGML